MHDHKAPGTTALRRLAALLCAGAETIWSNRRLRSARARTISWMPNLAAKADTRNDARSFSEQVGFRPSSLMYSPG